MSSALFLYMLPHMKELVGSRLCGELLWSRLTRRREALFHFVIIKCVNAQKRLPFIWTVGVGNVDGLRVFGRVYCDRARDCRPFPAANRVMVPFKNQLRFLELF